MAVVVNPGLDRSGQESNPPSPAATDTNTHTVTVSKEGRVNYYCKARRGDYDSEISDPATITVTARPKAVVSVQAADPDNVFTGETVTFSCEIKTRGSWQYHWFRDNNELSEAAGRKTFKISNVKESNKESPKPVVIIKPDKQVFSGETVTFRCDIQSAKYTEWTYIWNKKDYIEIQEFSISSVTVSDRESPKPMVIVKPDKQVTNDIQSAKYTEWTYDWNKNDYKKQQYKKTEEFSISSVTVSDSENPKLELTSDLKGAAVTGTSVTLSCTLKPHSAGWKFYWIKPRQSTETETHHYFIGSVRVSDGGQYKCRARRGNPVYYTDYSDALWVNVTGESPPVSLIISPSRTQHFTADSLSLSCDDQSDSTGWTDLYRLARQRDRDGKDVQQVRVIKDRDGRVLTSEESVQRRWKEYFEELMNEENEREKRVEGMNSVEQKVDKIRKDEVRKALKRMKSGKAVGPDDIPVEVWKCLGEAAVEFLASLFNRVFESERMPEEWRSVLVPIFKNKGDVQSCSNYRGIKLMSHTMKLWERVVEARLRKVVDICEHQYGFMPRKSTTDAIFALRILMEKYRDGQRELHCVFVDLEKAYDRVPREELWYCMRKSGVAEKYVRVVQDMYERSRTVVRCAVGQTEEFKVEVGLHQGSALSPFLFAIVMDQLSEEVRQESPWTMMFADDIVICSESREQVEENLERWRFALERRGMKVSRSKTEYMCVNEREGSGTVRLQGEEVKKVQEFKYLGSTVQSNGEGGKEVKKRVQAGWNGWRKMSGVLCDQKISARIKGKVYRTVVRPAMPYGLETVSLRKRQESELEVAELKMLRFSLGVTRLDRIRNEYIRGTAHVGRLGDKVREARLRWFGHVQRRE
ncbi:hypothetical protein QTP70_003792, partial [Hemibagrus guttatus]